MKIRDRAGGVTGAGPIGGARQVAKVAKVNKAAAAEGVAATSDVSHAAPVDCIQPPVFDSTLAVQRRANARMASGAKAEWEGVGVGAVNGVPQSGNPLTSC